MPGIPDGSGDSRKYEWFYFNSLPAFLSWHTNR
jgi:hypothetical protein